MKSVVCDRAQRDDMLVRPSVAHHADGAHRQEHGEGLRHAIVPAGRAQFVDEDRIGAAQQVGVFAP